MTVTFRPETLRGLLALSTSAALALSAGAALAQEEPAAPRSLAGLAECRTIESDAERLACYDRVVDSAGLADQSRRFVAVDVREAEAVERDGFGFNMPSLPRLSLSIRAALDSESVLSTDGPDADGSASATADSREEVEGSTARVLVRDEVGSIERIEFIVAEVRRRGFSDVIVEMTNGQVWLISEGRDLDILPRRVREGTPAVVRRAAMNSYLLQFNGRGSAYRASRLR